MCLENFANDGWLFLFHRIMLLFIHFIFTNGWQEQIYGIFLMLRE